MLSLIHTFFPVLIITSLAGFCWGMIWYHPRLFGRLWQTCQPHRNQPGDFQKYHKTIIGASLADSFFFSMMALVLGHSYGAEGWALLAISVGVGIFTNTVVKGNPLTLFAIDAGFLLSQLALIISILMISGLAP